MNKREWVRLVRDGIDLDAVSDAAGVPVRVDGWRFVVGDVGWLARIVTTSVSRGGKLYLTARIEVVASKHSTFGLIVHRPLGETMARRGHHEFIDVEADRAAGMRRVEELLVHDGVPWLLRNDTMSDVKASLEELVAQGVMVDVVQEMLASICALRLDRDGMASARDGLDEVVARLPEYNAGRARRDWVEQLLEADDAELEEMLRDTARSAVKELRLSKVDVDAFPFPITD